MTATATRQPFTGPTDRWDWLFVENVLGAMQAGDLGGLIRYGQALSPGSLSVLPALVGSGYGMAVYHFDAGLQLVAVLGTQSASQLIAELVASNLIRFDGLAGQVSAYFGFDAATFLASVKRNLDPTRPVVTIGHSLGGATAQLLAAYLSHGLGFTIQGAYTIGAPKVGNSDWVLSCTFPIWRLENSGDIVPSIPQPIPGLGLLPGFGTPPASWRDYVHAGAAITQNLDGSWSNGHIELSSAQVLAALVAGGIEQHFSGSYLARTMQGQVVPSNLVPFAHGYEKPWLLVGLQEAPVPPGEVTNGRVSVPANWTNEFAVYQLDRSGNSTHLGTTDDPPPLNWVPQLTPLPSKQRGCRC